MRSLGSRPWSVQDDKVEQLQAQPGSVPHFSNSETAKASAQAHTLPTLHLWVWAVSPNEYYSNRRFRKQVFLCLRDMEYWCLRYNDEICSPLLNLGQCRSAWNSTLHSPLNFDRWFTYLFIGREKFIFFFLIELLGCKMQNSETNPQPWSLTSEIQLHLSAPGSDLSK